MSISSSATGLRAGVCTSTTRPTNPYTGQIIYETDTGYLRVWDGAAWDYLSQKQDNTVGLGPVGGMILVKTQTIGTAVTSVSVSDAFNSSYDNYKITVSGGNASTGSGYLSLQLGSATSNYRYDYISANLAGATPTSVGSVGAANFPYIGFKATALHANVDVIGPFLTLPTMISAFAGQVGNNMGTFVGVQIDSTSFTGFTLSASTGTITGGTIRVYGYRNS